MANYMIQMPNSVTRCVTVDHHMLRNFIQKTGSALCHSCSSEDPCRTSFPCLSGSFFPYLVSSHYGIDQRLCKLDAKYGSEIKVEPLPSERGGHTSFDDRRGFLDVQHNGKLLESQEFNSGTGYMLKNDVTVTVAIRVLGGKGGFGALLKGKGKRKKQSTNIDSCRTLSGERVRHKRLKELSERTAEAKISSAATKLPRTKETATEDAATSIRERQSRCLKKLKKESTRIKKTVARGVKNMGERPLEAATASGEDNEKIEQALKECLDMYDLD